MSDTICNWCGVKYPTPVEYHHTEAECVANVEPPKPVTGIWVNNDGSVTDSHATQEKADPEVTP